MGQGFFSLLKNKSRGVLRGSAGVNAGDGGVVCEHPVEWKYPCRAPVCNRGARYEYSTARPAPPQPRTHQLISPTGTPLPGGPGKAILRFYFSQSCSFLGGCLDHRAFPWDFSPAVALYTSFPPPPPQISHFQLPARAQTLTL